MKKIRHPDACSLLYLKDREEKDKQKGQGQVALVAGTVQAKAQTDVEKRGFVQGVVSCLTRQEGREIVKMGGRGGAGEGQRGFSGPAGSTGSWWEHCWGCSTMGWEARTRAAGRETKPSTTASQQAPHSGLS
jgi:hypothetical protein